MNLRFYKYDSRKTDMGEINNKLMFPSGDQFYLDEHDGERGYNTDPARGADTFYPFKKEAITESSVYLYGKDSQRSFIVSFEGYTKLTYNSGGAIVTLDGASKPSSASNTEISDTRHSLVFSVNRGVDAHISYSVSN